METEAYCYPAQKLYLSMSVRIFSVLWTTYMKCDRDSIHCCGIVCNWSCTIGIRICLQHLANSGAEFIHGNGVLWRVCSGCREGTAPRSIQSLECRDVGIIKLGRQTCGAEHERRRPNLPPSWPRDRSTLKVMYHMADVDTCEV